MQLVDATRSKHLQTKSTHWRNITAGQKLLFSGALQSFKSHPPPFLGQFCQQLTWSAYNPCELLAQQSLNTSSHSITTFGLRFMKEDNLLHSLVQPWKGYLCGHAFPRWVALNPIISYWENLSTFLVIKIPLPHLPPPPSKHWALNMTGKLFTTEPYPQNITGTEGRKMSSRLVYTWGGYPLVFSPSKNLDFL